MFYLPGQSLKLLHVTYEISDFLSTKIQYYAAENIWFSFLQNMLLLLNENIYSFFSKAILKQYE